MKSLQILLIISGVFADGQTRARPEQIVNLQQLRVSGDARPGTLLSTSQIKLGRWVCRRPASSIDPAEINQPTICVDRYYGVQGPAGVKIVRSAMAYTSAGRDALLLSDPEWKIWWTVHQNDVPAPVADPAGALVFDLLTHPRP